MSSHMCFMPGTLALCRSEASDHVVKNGKQRNPAAMCSAGAPGVDPAPAVEHVQKQAQSGVVRPEVHRYRMNEFDSADALAAPGVGMLELLTGDANPDARTEACLAHRLLQGTDGAAFELAVASPRIESKGPDEECVDHGRVELRSRVAPALERRRTVTDLLGQSFLEEFSQCSGETHGRKIMTTGRDTQRDGCGVVRMYG